MRRYLETHAHRCIRRARAPFHDRSQRRPRRRAARFGPRPLPAFAADGAKVVINEAYLKGGSAGAPYTHKFVELYTPATPRRT
ncbi:hypothetical protein HR12_26225 [Microbacterium sp. SUBG005]|nr:hypothetical protein HR12_26225 [Microbacterium sp. SUBG005]